MMNRTNRIVNIIRKLGPGFLFAGAAIGVSHLVMSSSAGAKYGFGLLWAVLLANILKYPFFQFAPRYTGATGENLIQGYRKLGMWAIWIYLIITVGTMFTVQAAVTIVTAGVLSMMIPMISLSAVTWSIIILCICMLILMAGRYSLLDNLMKYIIVLLAICTVAAVLMSIYHPATAKTEFMHTFAWDTAGVAFLIALMGWMPAPLDLSVWNSIWAQEKRKQIGKLSMKDMIFDFNMGYYGAVVLAVCFLSVGALIIYGQGIDIPDKGGQFAAMLIDMYTKAFDTVGLGSVAYYVISIAAFTTMFSTTLTCLDAYPRVLWRVTTVFKENKKKRLSAAETAHKESKQAESTSKFYSLLNYWGWIVLVASGAIVLLTFLGGKMGIMVKIATILSFIPTPLFAYINYRLVTSDHMPVEAQPKKSMRVFSWVCMVLITAFCVYYFYSLF